MTALITIISGITAITALLTILGIAKGVTTALWVALLILKILLFPITIIVLIVRRCARNKGGTSE